SNAVAYRSLFATVFADFHLFDRLYGLRDVDPARVQALLETMDIASKTSFRDGAFTNLDLSTGQRRRLAFVAALLEDKPVYALHGENDASLSAHGGDGDERPLSAARGSAPGSPARGRVWSRRAAISPHAVRVRLHGRNRAARDGHRWAPRGIARAPAPPRAVV